MEMAITVRKVVLFILSAIAGAIFLYSAYSKANPIEIFEYTLVEFLNFPCLLAGVAARFFIALESSLGILLLFSIYGSKKWVLKATTILTLLFSLYIVYLWARFGNNVNCGCFGDHLQMGPAKSLVKNGILLVILWLLHKLSEGFHFKKSGWVIGIILIIFQVSMFVAFALPTGHTIFSNSPERTLNLDIVYAADPQDKPAVDWTKGKHIVAFFSPSCPHCRVAAFKLQAMKQQDTTLPFFMVIGGTTSNLDDFWRAAFAAKNESKIPWSRLDKGQFLTITGGIFPKIFFVNNGRVEAETDYHELDEGVIKKWLKEGVDRK